MFRMSAFKTNVAYTDEVRAKLTYVQYLLYRGSGAIWSDVLGWLFEKQFSCPMQFSYCT